MKSTFFTLFAVALLSLAFNAPVAKVAVDTSKSVIVWKGYKVTGSHEGTIRVKSGSLDMQDGMLKGGSFSTTSDIGCRVTHRLAVPRHAPSLENGFRVVREPPAAPKDTTQRRLVRPRFD